MSNQVGALQPTEEAAEPDLLEKLEGVALSWAQRISIVTVVGMIVLSALTILDIGILRLLLNAPIPGSNEVLSTFFAVAICGAFPIALARRAHLKVDFTDKLFGPSIATWLHVLGQIALLVMFVAVAVQVGSQAYSATLRHQATLIFRWPVAPFYWMMTAILAVNIPVQLIVLTRDIRNACRITGRNRAAVRVVAAGLVMAAAACWFVVFAAPGLSERMGGSPAIAAAVFLCLQLFLIVLSIPVGAALFFSAAIAGVMLLDFGVIWQMVGSEALGLLTNQDLAVIPLFLMMGSLMSVSRVSADIYRLASASFGFLRGGLAMATVAGSAGFGSVTGSSLATVATIGGMALPEMRARKYADGLAAGSVTAGATLGALIPPSTPIVIYAIVVEESIGKLFIAAMVPALLTMTLYMLAIALVVRLRPASAPGVQSFDTAEFLGALKGGLPVLVIFLTVFGGIYTGIFTATEAAAVGAGAAFVFAVWRRALTRQNLFTVVSETAVSTAVIYLLILGANLATFLLGMTSVANLLSEQIAAAGLAPLTVVILIVVSLVLLGCITDSFTIMILTAPILVQVVSGLGYDRIWWAMIMLMVVELGVVTPPFGIHLFMIKSISKDVSFKSLCLGVLPFVAADGFKIALLVAFPIIILWLPGLMASR